MRRLSTFTFIALFALAGSTVHAGPAVRNLADMVAAGHYDRANPEVNERNFTVKPERFTTEGVQAISLGRTMSTAEVLAELDRRGVRSATVEQLLAYGAEHPDEQLKNPIVALGSSLLSPFGYILAPVLTKGAEGRVLSLPWVGPGPVWFAAHRFLVVPK